MGEADGPVDPWTGEPSTDSVDAWKKYFQRKYAPNGGIPQATVAAVKVVDLKTLEVVFYNATGEYTEMLTITMPDGWMIDRLDDW